MSPRSDRSPALAERIDSVLVVDDSEVQRRFAAALCQRLGVRTVHEAGNGEQALSLLHRLAQPPALLVIDLEMPVMDGIELIQQLLQSGMNIPFVVASSRETSLVNAAEVMARTMGLQVLGGLRKPLTQAALARVFEHALQARAPASEAARPAAQAVDPEALRRAIAEGRVRAHYQPKVDMRTGLLRGVEVLARWTDADQGAVPPDRFIPAAEQHGLIHALTLSILDQALRQAAHWKSRGLGLALAVNLSPRLLDDAQLVERICAAAERHGVVPSQVVFELTEGSVVTSSGTALGALARLRMRGFGLSIDDYGTGFSSMQQLARLPFTELKIDRSFVHGASEHENLRVMLQSALDMARRLGLTTVAEGIETPEDWRLLQQFGCDIGQGWLIAAAMSARDLVPWLRAHRTRLAELRAPVSSTTTQPA
jgi:EAL domain-containing protein (putative c-di-GMP-specific phosphodiesterase class I)/FixJ family two-component response regulator